PSNGTDNNSASRDTTVTTRADLSITKTGSATVDGSASATDVIAGTNLTYTITVTNGGPSDAQGISLSESTPAHTTFVAATPSSGGTCATQPALGGTGAIGCSWAGATIPTGTRTLTLVVHVDADAVLSSTISNTASTSSP